jgi:hypothetical protein
MVASDANKLRSSEFLRENQLHTPAGTEISLSPSGFDWVSHRDSGITPRYVSSLDGSEAGRDEFLEGARLLRLDRPGHQPTPQQLWIADAMNATREDGSPVASVMGILAARRSTKTTSAIAVALGRCALRPGYQVAFTLATTRDKAAVRFRKDIVTNLELAYPDEDTRPFKIRKSNGSEWITWPSGSMFQVVTPSSEGFRSESFDLILCDESGEASPELSEDILLGALATMDTRPNAQFVALGTAANYRTGNLAWDILEKGRAGEPGYGIVEYSAYDPAKPLTAEDVETWAAVEPIVLAAHPGIGNLVKLETVQARHAMLKPASFLRDYLSIFGQVGVTGGLFDMEQWGLGAIATKYPRPPAEGFSLALYVHPDQTSASIVAAWRVRGKARILVLKSAPGVEWVAEAANKLALKYDTAIVHDSKGPVLVQTDAIKRIRGHARLKAATFKEVQTAHSLFLSEAKAGNVQHYNQPTLNAAIAATVKRSSYSAVMFARRQITDDITAVEAAALALRDYDNRPKRMPLPRMTAA